MNFKTSTVRILFIFKWSTKLQVSDRAWVLKYQLECDKVQWLQTHCGQTWISLGRLLYKDILFLCPRWSSGPYISMNIHIWTHFVNASWKKSDLRTQFTHAHFQYNSRKLVNVVKVSFTMMYSSRKWNNKKVITTACNFWRQIACSIVLLNVHVYMKLENNASE